MRVEAGPGSTVMAVPAALQARCVASCARVGGVPQRRGRRRVALVRLAVGEAHELELHAPRGEEVHPSLPLAVTRAGRRFAEDTHPVAAQVLDGQIEVLDVEREVVATDVAVAGLRRLAFGGLPLEDLEVGAGLAAVEAQLAHDSARVHVQVLGHPVVVLDEGAERVDVLATEHVDEERVRFVEVGDGEADVLGADQAGERHGSSWVGYKKTSSMPNCVPQRCDRIQRDLDSQSRPRRSRENPSMPQVSSLQASVPWVEVSTTPEDWASADPTLLATMLGQMQLIRAFEELVLQLAREGLVHGPAHSSIGQEGGAVGSVLALGPTDGVNGSHRGHHQFLAKAIAFVAPQLDLENLVTEELRTVLHRTLAEILGLADGFCRGRGGSMHLQWMEAGALGTNAIVGGGVPLAAGNAWAQKHAGTTDVTVTYFGDGATNIGSVLESMNLTAAWDLPLCFFIENNLYAVSTHVEEVTGESRLSGRGPGFGIASWRVDGMDPLAVYLAMQAATEHMRAGKGPAVVEAEVYRYFHQNGPFPGSAFGYRSKEEEAHWRSRDPIDRVAAEMVSRGLLDEDR